MSTQPGRKPATLRKLDRIAAHLTVHGPQTALQIALATDISSNLVRHFLTLDERFVIVDVVGTYQLQVWSLKGQE